MQKSFLNKMKIPFEYIDQFGFIFNWKKIQGNEILKNIFTDNNLVVDVVDLTYFYLDVKVTEGKRIVAEIYYNDRAIRLHPFGTLIK